MKKNNLILVALVAIVAVAGLGFYAMSRDDNNSMMDSDDTSMMQSNAPMANRDSSTYKEYAALKGEDYDRLFIANMIAHHQGAVDMANLALKNAKHQEIKDLATAIVTAQTTEILDGRDPASYPRYVTYLKSQAPYREWIDSSMVRDSLAGSRLSSWLARRPR